jgi:hypothetical protein
MCKKKIHVEAKPMLEDEKIMLCTMPDSLTATQADPTARTQGSSDFLVLEPRRDQVDWWKPIADYF